MFLLMPFTIVVSLLLSITFLILGPGVLTLFRSLLCITNFNTLSFKLARRSLSTPCFPRNQDGSTRHSFCFSGL